MATFVSSMTGAYSIEATLNHCGPVSVSFTRMKGLQSWYYIGDLVHLFNGKVPSVDSTMMADIGRHQSTEGYQASLEFDERPRLSSTHERS